MCEHFTLVEFGPETDFYSLGYWLLVRVTSNYQPWDWKDIITEKGQNS